MDGLGATAEGLTDFLLSFFPEASDDSFATVNLLGAASLSDIEGAAPLKWSRTLP